MTDTEDALTLEPHPAVLAWIAERRSPIYCNDLVEFGYPFRYRINEGAIAAAGYAYDIYRDAWVRP